MAELDEDNSSFEVIEEEVPLPDFEDPLKDSTTLEHPVDQLCGSCLYVDDVALDQKNEALVLESSCPSIISEKEDSSESSVVVQSIDSHEQCVSNVINYRQMRPKLIRSLYPVDFSKDHIVQTGAQLIFTHQKCVALLAALLGITLALLWTTVRYSYHASRLEDELARNKLQHADEILHLSKEKHCDHESTMRNLLSELEQERRLLHELRLQSEERLNREVQAEKLTIELQRDRDKLVDEIRGQSERYAAREKEHTDLILELQAERHQLIDALEKSNRKHNSDRKTRDSVWKKLWKMKQSFRGMGNVPQSIPGMDYVQRFICQLPHLCDDY